MVKGSPHGAGHQSSLGSLLLSVTWGFSGGRMEGEAEVGCEQHLEAALSKVRAAVRDGNLARKGCLR